MGLFLLLLYFQWLQWTKALVWKHFCRVHRCSFDRRFIWLLLFFWKPIFCLVITNRAFNLKLWINHASKKDYGCGVLSLLLEAYLQLWSLSDSTKEKEKMPTLSTSDFLLFGEKKCFLIPVSAFVNLWRNEWSIVIDSILFSTLQT